MSKLPEPKSYGDLYPGRFLRADSSTFANGKKPVFTIDRIILDELEGEDGKEVKVIMTFAETPLSWILPKLCALGCKQAFGADVTKWRGKRLCLFATDTQMPFPVTRAAAETARREGKPAPKPEPCLRIFGSPDIAEDFTYAYLPPRRKTPVMVTWRGPRKQDAPANTTPPDDGQGKE